MLLDDAGLIAAVVFVIRVLTLPLLVINALFTYSGIINILKGNFAFSEFYRSVIFLIAVPMFGFHVTAITELRDTNPGIYALVFLMMYFMAFLVSGVGWLLFPLKNLRKLSWLYSHPNLDLAMKSLAISDIDRGILKTHLNIAEEKSIKKFV